MKNFVLFILGAIAGAAATELRKKENRDAIKNWCQEKYQQATKAAEEAEEKVEDLLDEGEAANGGNAAEQPKTE